MGGWFDGSSIAPNSAVAFGSSARARGGAEQKRREKGVEFSGHVPA
ncbi:MAG: hypothetical protein HZT43_18385 [Exiguobacterium profundum]|nr:MAG: hypothetical protein HZT43_18385 [Exiguobacterium profundum]